MSALAALSSDLASLAKRDRLRTLRSAFGVDFASNDYLALASSPRLAGAVRDALERGVAVGSGGSRLLRGNCEDHERLEAEAALFFGTRAALYFSSGFAANTTLFASVPQHGDLVVHDELIHASAHDGMRLGRAETRSVQHNDAGAFDDAIVRWRRGGGTGRPWIATESLFSMDGDRAPLDNLMEVADRHEGGLLIDEAHATGVFGREGRGLAERFDGRENVITLRTCGKALGCEGALLCMSATVREFIINRGRGFIFSTAPSPLMAAAVREALRILADEPERRARLWKRIVAAERALARCGMAPTGSQILPLVLGDDTMTMRVAGAVQAAGFDVRGIRPPTVPPGTSRLRISLTLNASLSDIEALADVLAAALR